MYEDRPRRTWRFGRVDLMLRRRWLGSYGVGLSGRCLDFLAGDRGCVGIVVDPSGLELGRRKYATGLVLMDSSGGVEGERDFPGDSGHVGVCF